MDGDLKILLVEDDAALAASLVDELQAFGHAVEVARDGPEALARVGNGYFDAIILDRLLPLLDGISVLERLRREQVTIPIIMLTALARATEKVEGLSAGADDYVAKPVTAAELDARLRALLRGRQWTRASETLRAGDITVSPTKFRAWRSGKAVDLPKVEMDLLIELARNVDSVMTRAMLLERVWGYDFDPKTNIVETYIRRLRVKLMADGGEDPITTVRGVGYALKG